MENFAPMNLGNVLAQGENIKGARMRNAMLAKEQDPNSISNQMRREQLAGAQQGNVLAREQAGRERTRFGQEQAKYGQQQNIENIKLMNMAAAELLENPAALERWEPLLKQSGAIKPEADMRKLTPQDYQAIYKGTSAALGKQAGPARPGLGKYNPGDYTPQSWKAFTEGEYKSPGVLERYEAPSITSVGGAPSIVSRSGGVPGRVTPLSTPEAESTAKADVAAKIDTAKQEVKKKAFKPKAKAAILDLERQTATVNSNIDKALEAISPWSTGAGAWFKDMPNSEAGKLDRILGTIKANVGFDKLQRMRDNSPTGGALGAVSELENRLLQVVNGALDPTQRDLLEENLASIKQLYTAVLEERKAAYNTDYGNEFEVAQPDQGPSQEDLEFTAKKHGITVEEVKRRMGAR